MEALPIDLKTNLSIHIYRDFYENVEFLKDRSPQFISWICPILKVRVASPQETIYYENEALSNVYFLKSGPCNYVLPAYNSEPFLRIEPNTSFGLIDFIAALRRGEIPNDTRFLCDSTLTAIMGRESAYTGKKVTWDEMLNSNLQLTPPDIAAWDGSIRPVPRPGMIRA